MKFFVHLLLGFSLLFCLSNSPLWAQAQIEFEEDTYEFEEIKEGEKVKRVFTYTNVGNQPLILSDLRTTCGCTASEWSKEPLEVGKTQTITIVFDSKGKPGRQHKTVSVFSNATNEPVYRLRLYGNVLPKN
jgi:hypothetical protein